MPKYPSMDRLADVQQLVADFAKVTRAVNLANNGQPENDVEHSYGLAITCWFLHDKIASELDIEKIFKYALSHDIVELHAGDTYVFDEAAVATKVQREHDANQRLSSEWPDFTELTSYAAGYANKRDAESRFVYAVDKLLPIMMIELDDAKAVWSKKKITLEMERTNKMTVLQSEIMSPYYEMLLDWLDGRGNIPKR